MVAGDTGGPTRNSFPVIGEEAMKENDITAQPCVYDPQTDPSIINSIAAAAIDSATSYSEYHLGENQPWRFGQVLSGQQVRHEEQR